MPGSPCPDPPTAKPHDAFAARAAEIGYADWRYDACPVQLWDLFGEQGHPIRTTVSEMGPLLLARLLNLNEVQEGVLAIAFHVADKDGLLLLDLDDLQAMLVATGERADELTLEYGNVSKPSVGAIQRSLLQLRAQGGDHFFGEPALDLEDFLKLDEAGKGVVNILAADKLMASPAALFDLPAVAAQRIVRAAARGRRHSTSPSSPSSSTRRICCSTTPRRRCSKRSSRSSG